MVTWLRRFLSNLLWDEAAAQRYIASGMFLLGAFLESGGVIPGSTVAVPNLAWAYPYGAPLKALGIFMAAGGAIPTGARTTAVVVKDRVEEAQKG